MRIDLSSGWQVAQLPPACSVPADASGLDWIPAIVPGAVQYDLVRAGRLRNPFASTEAAREAGWVAESDWLYRVQVPISDPEAAQHLHLEGVDTFADVWLNGELLGRTANANRGYRFDLAGRLVAGENELLVHLKAHRRMVADMAPEAERRLSTSGRQAAASGKSLLRRYQRSFFSSGSLLNLGTEILGIGINKPVRVESRSSVLTWQFTVDSVAPERAAATLGLTLDAPSPEVVAELRDPRTNDVVARAAGRAEQGRLTLPLSVDRPRLWWPRGYGDAALYDLAVTVTQGGDRHVVHHRVGLRRVELVERLENGRKTFQLRANGTAVYVRGYNLIPLDYVKVHGDWPEYERMLRLVCAGNGNLIRIWGGGAIESDRFYAACDELGLMVWQDFLLHSGTYPDYDERWVHAFSEESRDIVARLRNHPSLSLWCGGNEQMQGWDEWNWQGELDQFYGERLFTEVLPRVVRELDPATPYIVNSPHGGRGSQSPVEGDMHCWGNFFNASKDPVFVTETCWNLQSYSRPETLRSSMDLDVGTYGELGWPARWRERTNLPLVTKFPFSGCDASRTLAEYLRGLEIEHAFADQEALTQLRLHGSSCHGIVYWSLNKGAPLFEFGCVDYEGRPLLNWYAVRRAFADVAIDVYRDVDDVRVVGSNLGAEPVHGTLSVRLVDFDGTVRDSLSVPVDLPSGGIVRLAERPGLYARVKDRTRELVVASLEVDGEVAARDTLLFCPVSEFQTRSGVLTARVFGHAPGPLHVELESETIVNVVWLDGNRRWLFEDNGFTLVPGERQVLSVESLDADAAAGGEITVSALREGAPLRLTVE